MMDYDRNRKPTSIYYPDPAGDSTQTWTQNYFGDPVPFSQGAGHVDLSGTNYYFEYDFKQQVVHKYSDVQTHHGGFLALAYDNQLGYSVVAEGSSQQDLRFIYQRGLITQVADQPTFDNILTTIRYDSEGRRIYYSLSTYTPFSSDIMYNRELTTQYDNLAIASLFF